MTEAPKPSDDEICPMCKRPKSKHTDEEMLVCSHKMKEFQKEKRGGAGIEWTRLWNLQKLTNFSSLSSSYESSWNKVPSM